MVVVLHSPPALNSAVLLISCVHAAASAARFKALQEPLSLKRCHATCTAGKTHWLSERPKYPNLLHNYRLSPAHAASVLYRTAAANRWARLPILPNFLDTSARLRLGGVSPQQHWHE